MAERSRYRWCMAVVSSCREVLRLSPATSATPPRVASIQLALTRDCRRQAGGRRGRRQVIMPLMPWAAHVLQWPAQWVATPRGGADPKSRPQFGSQAATRLREAGVASNRGSARRGEYVPGPCTPPVTPRVVCTRSRRPGERAEASKVWRVRVKIIKR